MKHAGRIACAVALVLLTQLAATSPAAQAAPEDRPLYNAQETVRRAQIGSNSPRLAPPSRVLPAEVGAKPDPAASSGWSAGTTPPDPWATVLFANLGEPNEQRNPRIHHPLG